MPTMSAAVQGALAVTEKNGIRRFSNARLQAALDSAIAEMGPDDHVAVVAHHVYHDDGTEIENVTVLSAVVRPPKDSKFKDVSIMVGGFKDWTKGDLGAEAKVVWKPKWW